jgi:hypothetical protein
LQRTRLHFVRIEAQGFEIQISRSEQISGASTVGVQNNQEQRDHPDDVTVRSPNVGVFNSAVPYVARGLEVGAAPNKAAFIEAAESASDHSDRMFGQERKNETRDFLAPEMFWYGWTATAMLGALVVGFTAALLPARLSSRIWLGWVWVAPVLAMMACGYLTIPWFRQ